MPVDHTRKAGGAVSLTMVITLAGLTIGVLALGLRLAEPSRDCRACRGLGLERGARGRFTRFCRRCRGSGRVDGLVRRALVVVTRGRVLPEAGSVAPGGRQHGQGVRFNGRFPGGRWRAAPDPDDTRLAALERWRVPAAQRRVDRAAAHAVGARGLPWVIALVRRAAARRALRRAEDAAERHRLALSEHLAGYRRKARAVADRSRRATG
ncbi:hypothetical protein [Pseudonocardia alni]|uniref:hypothetical protein n=1 Tax=Pseudonocardia alni TaxID=33907 RepID=UPI00332641F1